MAGSIPSWYGGGNNQDPQPAQENVEENNLFDNNFLNVSNISDPATAYVIPDVRNPSSKFIYNYFVKNEREINSNNNGNNIIIESNYDDNFDIDYLLKQSELTPRSVLLTFKQTNVSNLELTENEKTLLENFDPKNMSVNGGIFNPQNLLFNLGLTDSDSTKKITEQIKNSSLIIKNESVGDQSYQDLGKSIADLLNNPGGVTGIGKKILMEKINVSRSKGFALSPSENSEVLSTDPVGNITFNIKINKLFPKSILRYSTSLNAGIFETETKSIEKFTDDLRENILTQIEASGGPDAINDKNHGLYAIPLDMRPIPENVEDLSSLVSRKNAGYLIEKLEQFPDDSIVKRDSIFITNKYQTQYLDTDVRYGAKYIYKIRSVILFEAPTVLLNEDPSLDQSVLAKILVASDGVDTKIFCVENIPPKAPSAINARMDFKLKKPVIRWQFPVNKQRDIKRFQIFKRLNENSPFTLIAEYNFDNSITPTAVKEKAQSKNLYNLNPKIPKLSYTDMNFNINQKPIYAIASVDAHGLTSNLSTQIKIEYLKYENRLKVDLFSREGAPKQYPNLYINQDTFLDNIKTSGYDRMILYFDPEYYRVFQNEIPPEQAALVKEGQVIPEKDLGHIAVNPTRDTYKIHIINLDMQKEETINIRIEDASSGDLKLDGSSFNALRHNNFLN